MRRSPFNQLLRYLALLMVMVWSVFPILTIVLGSLKPGRELFQYPPQFIFQPTFDNYARLLAEWPVFFRSLLNSLIIASGATLITVAAALLAGYAFSRYRGKVLTGSAFFSLFVRMIPPIVITLPLFPVVNALGLNDTKILLILLYATFYVSLGTWIAKAFIDDLPIEIEESARIDGANLAQLLWHVVTPLAAKGLVAVGVFVFIYSWNEFLFAFIFTTTDAQTAPLVLSLMMDSIQGVDWGVLFAAATAQLLPIVILAVLAQRFIVAGLTAGSVKG